jgi:hypothetical protein
MKTFVEFRSSKFPAYSGEEEEINPGIWGRRLAEHLIERLEQNGIETNGYFMEDWGYYLPIEIEGCRFGLARILDTDPDIREINWIDS